MKKNSVISCIVNSLRGIFRTKEEVGHRGGLLRGRSFGLHEKRCKSCDAYGMCKACFNPMQRACEDYR